MVVPTKGGTETLQLKAQVEGSTLTATGAAARIAKPAVGLAAAAAGLSTLIFNNYDIAPLATGGAGALFGTLIGLNMLPHNEYAVQRLYFKPDSPDLKKAEALIGQKKLQGVLNTLQESYLRRSQDEVVWDLSHLQKRAFEVEKNVFQVLPVEALELHLSHNGEVLPGANVISQNRQGAIRTSYTNTQEKSRSGFSYVVREGTSYHPILLVESENPQGSKRYFYYPNDLAKRGPVPIHEIEKDEILQLRVPAFDDDIIRENHIAHHVYPPPEDLKKREYPVAVLVKPNEYVDFDHDFLKFSLKKHLEDEVGRKFEPKPHLPSDEIACRDMLKELPGIDPRK